MAHDPRVRHIRTSFTGIVAAPFFCALVADSCWSVCGSNDSGAMNLVDKLSSGHPLGLYMDSHI